MPGPDARVERRAPATLVLGGALVFPTVTNVLRRAGECLREGHHDTLDLRDVTSADSAGLACVLAVMATARRLGQQLQPVHVPADLASLAQVCEVDALLG